MFAAGASMDEACSMAAVNARGPVGSRRCPSAADHGGSQRAPNDWFCPGQTYAAHPQPVAARADGDDARLRVRAAMTPASFHVDHGSRRCAPKRTAARDVPVNREGSILQKVKMLQNPCQAGILQV